MTQIILILIFAVSSLVYNRPASAQDAAMDDLSVLESVTPQHNFSTYALLGSGVINVRSFGQFADRDIEFSATDYRLDYSFHLPLNQQVAIQLGTTVGYTDFTEMADVVLEPKVFLVPGVTAGLVVLGSSKNHYTFGISYAIERWENFGYELKYLDGDSEGSEVNIANEASFVMQIFELRVAWDIYWNPLYGLKLMGNYSSSRMARPLGAQGTLLTSDVVVTSMWAGIGANIRFF